MKLVEIINSPEIEETKDDNKKVDEKTKRKNMRLMMASWISFSMLFGIALGNLFAGSLFGVAIAMALGADILHEKMSDKKEEK